MVQKLLTTLCVPSQMSLYLHDLPEKPNLVQQPEYTRINFDNKLLIYVSNLIGFPL